MNKTASIPPDMKICQFCQSRIKPSETAVSCPSCGSLYHSECWYEGGGCSVYGCRERNSVQSGSTRAKLTVKEKLVHIEFLINRRKFTDALNECMEILNNDNTNNDAKVLYNRCTSYQNTKIKLLESAEEAYLKKDFRSASIFYKNYLKYCDEIEYDFISSKLRYIEERIPQIKRQKIALNLIYASLSAAIVAVILFSVYYFVVLNDEREFSEIARNESAESIKDIELFISKYEKFAGKTDDRELIAKAEERISALSDILIRKIYKNDWKTSLTYLKKIDKKNSPKTYNDLYRLIYSEANLDLASCTQKAKKLDKSRKFAEARAEIDKALNIIENFPDSEIEANKQILIENKSLLGKKLTLSVKYATIEDEIRKKTEELKEYGDSFVNSEIISINARIMKHHSGRTYIAKNIASKKLLALKMDAGSYSKGDEISGDFVPDGKITVEDDYGNEIILPVFIRTENYPESYPDYEKQSIIQRLNYLKTEKNRIDSLLKIGI